MKRIILPLLAAAPTFSQFVSTANAGAITFDSSALRPRLLSAAAFNKTGNGSVPTGAIRLPRLLAASNDIVPAIPFLGGTLQIGSSGSLLTTGAGTLTLTGSTNFSGGTLNLGVDQTLDSLDISGNVVTLGNIITPPNPPLSADTGEIVGENVTGGVLQILTVNGGSIRANASSGSINLAAPAAALPVPEPGSAMLLAIGALAASHGRRRRGK